MNTCKRPAWGVMLVTLLAGLLLMACQPIQAPAAEESRPNRPTYAARGPFGVGFQILINEAESGNGLEIQSWYPALVPASAEETIDYAVTLKDSTWQPTTQPIAHGHALRNAAIDASRGPYPLVVLSHGFMLSPAWYHTLAEHFASYGFIVLAPDHPEEFDPTFDEMWKTLIDRPAAVTATLDYAEALAAPGGAMAGLINMANVAVVGHSYGGYTALAAAGAQYDMAAYKARCATLEVDDPLTFFCLPIVPNETAMAERAGLAAVPDGLWPSFGDPRVTAIIPMAGDSYLFDEAGLAQVTVPLMAIAGSADTGTPLDWGAKPAYDHAASTQKSLVVLEGGEHMLFTTPCENQPWLSEHPYYEYFCFDPTWEKAQALDLIHHLSTAFLLDTLKGDPDAHAALLPAVVQFPGVAYTTTLP
ncbi:MAG: alpha/beta fold hydrolase [Caldilineaceae bacterium]